MAKTSKSADHVSPVRKQYLDIKSQYANALLFFRLGDFYETFDEDAEVVARELDIVLTSRNVAKGVRVPMAGIPHHAMDNYLSRLIDRGYHVAVCEQVGDTPVNGLMPREVVRTITPGTVVEPSLLASDANNYLAAVVMGEDAAGVAYVDITTGEFAATELNSEDILSVIKGELNRLHPAEILLPDTFDLDTHNNGIPGYKTVWPAWRFEPGRTSEAVLNHFQAASLDGFGFRGKDLAVRAAGAILQYLKDTQPRALELLTGVSTYSLDEFMNLDANTRRNLELVKTIRDGKVRGALLGIVDRTITPMGTRLMRQWVNKPLLDIGEIKKRQEGVTLFYNDGLGRAELRHALKPLADLERLSNRVVGGSAAPRDLTAIRETLYQLPGIQTLLPKGVAENIPLCEDEHALLQAALVEEPPATTNKPGIFRPG
ncbi:MAG: DNA mismatch repair protein MutS, partial [Anaerolineae bacterium]|nr:DNA mismatch repair protein MutS [Anaerolineae bacterium]